jgi:dienelactone hydrolase
VRTRIVAGLVAGALALAGCGTDTVRQAAPIPAGPSTAAPTPSESGPVSAPPVGRAPSQPFEVAVRADTFVRDGTRTLRTTIFHPTGSGRFPLVVFSHGLGGAPGDFAPLLRTWAAAGFVVVAPAYPKTTRGTAEFDVGDVLNQPADASFVVTQVLAGPLAARIDPAQIAAAGHSAGGITTVGLFTVARDPRLRAGLVFAGAAVTGTAFLGAAAPILFVHGDADEVLTYASGKAVFDALPWPKALLSLPGQGHSPPYQRESNPAYQAVSKSTVDFLRYAFYGDATARGRLAEDAKPGVLDDRL